MSLFISSLNSGSNGNCYYIGNSKEGILIDAGISCRETEKRMSRLGLSLNNVKAVFISHEHFDHINGISVLAHKYQLPVYITPDTLKGGRLQLKEHLVKVFRAYEPVIIGELCITAFPKLHDAAEPHSFIIEYAQIKVGVFTDIGFACEHVISNFKQCHAAFLEANYDEEMLDKGGYPYYLKNRIRGGMGHLSNSQALQLFLDHRPAFMRYLLLSHLSKNNNSPEIVENMFNMHAGNTKMIIASRFRETEIYRINHQDHSADLAGSENTSKPQLSLF